MLFDQMFEEFPADDAGRRAAPAGALEQLPSFAEEGERGPNSAPADTSVASLGSARSARAALPAPGFGQVKAGFEAGLGGGQDVLPVLAPLAGLLPGGVRRGDAVAVQSRDRTCDHLTLALLAGALAAGLWCAAVGVPELGGVALAELLATGSDPHGHGGLERLLLAPEPGDRWAQVAVAMADGVDLVLVRPPGPVDAAVGRRVDARLRQGRSTETRHSAALVVLGPWPSARVVLHTERTAWVGLEGAGPQVGTGHLRGGVATVVARGRATGGRTRSVELWLPAQDGTARAVGGEVGPASPADKHHRLSAVA